MDWLEFESQKFKRNLLLHLLTLWPILVRKSFICTFVQFRSDSVFFALQFSFVLPFFASIFSRRSQENDFHVNNVHDSRMNAESGDKTGR